MTLAASPFAGMPAYRDLSGAWYAVMGIERDSPTVNYGSLESFARAPADEAWVFSCFRRLYQAAQQTPHRVYVKAGNDLIAATDDNRSDEGDALQALLDYVAPYDVTGTATDMTGSSLKAYTIASYAAWGECYWAKVRGIYGGPPQEIHWLRAPDIETPTDNGRTPREYIHRPSNGPQTPYLPRDVVPFKTPNLANPLRGLSPLSSVRSDIATGRAWSEKLAAQQSNDSIPAGYWQVPKDTDFTKQDENLVRRTLRVLRERRNKGRVPIMPTGIEFKAIALTPHDAEMIAQRKLSRMSVCAALGVPLVLAGDDDKNTVYGNLRDAKRLFWTDTMIPLLAWYADAVNKALVPEFDPTRRRLVTAFDTSAIEALRPAWDVEFNAYMNGVYGQAVVPNEVRRRFQIGPDVPWGDKPVPRTQISVKAPETDTLLIPSLDPGLPGVVLDQPVEDIGDQADVAATLRSFDRGLYKHPAVKAWIGSPFEQLDVIALFGRPISDAVRTAIEAGLRRRDPAARIAASLEVPA